MVFITDKLRIFRDAILLKNIFIFFGCNFSGIDNNGIIMKIITTINSR
ncbi:MAG: hypothetical protein PHD33_04320 [Atribacterota bacterium]|nr:hypothetical protein [Atribacterota bacterium]